ncbi:hypothetical protein SD436_01285 [Streptococcus sp. 2A/TPW/M5]
MTCFQIVQLDQESKKYIMDTSTMSPKSYYWGFKTDTITVGMVEIEKNNNQFEIKPTTPVSTTMAAIIVQPIVKIGYDVIKRLFIKNNLSEQVLLKLLLFAISMLISYFAILISLKVAHKKQINGFLKTAINTQLPLQLLRKVMEEYILWLEQFSFVYFSFLV